MQRAAEQQWLLEEEVGAAVTARARVVYTLAGFEEVAPC